MRTEKAPEHDLDQTPAGVQVLKNNMSARDLD